MEEDEELGWGVEGTAKGVSFVTDASEEDKLEEDSVVDDGELAVKPFELDAPENEFADVPSPFAFFDFFLSFSSSSSSSLDEDEES